MDINRPAAAQVGGAANAASRRFQAAPWRCCKSATATRTQRVAAGATAAAASPHSYLADSSLRAFSQQPAQPVRSERKHRHGARSLAGLEEARFRGRSPSRRVSPNTHAAAVVCLIYCPGVLARPAGAC